MLNTHRELYPIVKKGKESASKGYTYVDEVFNL